MHIMTELGWTLFPVYAEPPAQSSQRNSLDPYIVDFYSLDDCISFAKYCRGDFVVLQPYEPGQYRIVERHRMHLYEGAIVWPSV